MARPIKPGIDYFPLDVTLDTKFELIEAEFGLDGFAIVVKLFQHIYGGQGYYCEWTNEVALLFARKCCVGVNVVSEIVKAALKRGIFDKGLYDKYSILTSSGIQCRYLTAKKGDSKKLCQEYLLISVPKNNDSVAKTRVLEAKTGVLGETIPQSKGKESKVNKSKGERNAPTLDDVRTYCKEKGYDNYNYEKFYNYYSSNGWTIKGNAPLINWKTKLDSWYKDDIEKIKGEQGNKSITPPKGIFNNYKQQTYSEGELEEILRRKNGNV